MTDERLASLIIFYADYSEIPLSSGKYLTELTWLQESPSSRKLSCHHYFVDYPGARVSERQITNVVGGNPLVRYSAATVIRTFINDIPQRSIIALRSAEKVSRFKQILKDLDIKPPAPLCILEDVCISDQEIAGIESTIFETKQAAAKRFGSAL